MRRIGVLSGAGYHNQRGGLERVHRVLRSIPGVPHREVRGPEDVEVALTDLDRLGTEVLVLNGGDGTVSMALTSLLRRRGGGPLPLLALLPGGRTNMSAGDVGLRGEPARQLERLIRWARDEGEILGLVRRPVLRIEVTPSAAPIFGLFFGAGLIYHVSCGTWNFHDRSRFPLMDTGLGTAVHVTRSLASIFAGRSPFDPTRIGVRLDGEDLEEQDFAVLFATSLDRMALGLRPFWGDGAAPLRFTAVTHGYRRLLSAAVSGLRGRVNRFLTPENGFLSRRVHEIELRFEGGATIDGEVVRPRSDEPVRIRVERSMSFIQPCSPDTIPLVSPKPARVWTVPTPLGLPVPAAMSSDGTSPHPSTL